jgi:PEP-CTERM motif
MMNNMYEFPSRVVTLWVIALSLVIGTGASAEATSITWDFTGSGSKGAHIDQRHGDTSGRLDVDYPSRHSNGNTTSDYDHLRWRDADYNDHHNVAWGGVNHSTGVSEDAWPQTSRHTHSTIFDTAYNPSNISFGPTNANGLIMRWKHDGFSVDTDKINCTDSPPSTAVPEPSTLLLLGAGFVGLAAWRLKKSA